MKRRDFFKFSSVVIAAINVGSKSIASDTITLPVESTPKEIRYNDRKFREKWYNHGKLYREDGPAIERVNGSTSRWVNGRLHREDSPAIL